jgi:hypothetical protein
VTVVLRDDDPPDIAAGLQFDGSYYELRTTATVTGPITVCITYTDAAVPEGMAEDSLAILYWDGDKWADATVSRNAATNTICAQMDSLSPVALYGERQARFADVPGWGYGDDGLSPYWAYYAIHACADGGVVTGYPDGTYQPAGQVDRAQMAVYIARALAGNEGSVPPFVGTPTFSDADENHWAYKHIEYAVSQNVVKGYDDGTYKPDLVVDRGQMAVFVARAMVTPSGDAGIPDPVPPATFPDVPSDFWAYKQVEYCVGREVVKGYDDGSYRPRDSVTRDQMAVYVARALLW